MNLMKTKMLSLIDCDNKDDSDCKVYVIKEGIWKEKEKSFFTGSRNLKLDTPIFDNGDVLYLILFSLLSKRWFLS
jgi:hypothetical protein